MANEKKILEAGIPQQRLGGRGFGGGGRFAPTVKPKDLKGTLKRLWKYFSKERKLLVVIFCFIVLDSVITLSFPYLIGKAIDTMSGDAGSVNFSALGMIITVLALAYISDGLLTFTQGWLMAGFSQRIVKRLRDTLFNKLQKLAIAFFDTHIHGDIMSRLTNDIDNVSTTISQSIIQLMTGIITIAGSLFMMLYLSPLLTLASCITIPLVFILTKTIAKKTKALFKEQSATLGKLNGHIEESISGLHVIKAFNHEEKIISEFEGINDKLKDVSIKAMVISGFLMPIMNVITNIGFVAVASVGGMLAVNGLITVGIIASFLNYSRQFTRPLNDLANIFNTLQSAVAGAERVFEILDEQEEDKDTETSRDIGELQGHVVFEDVSFGYRKDVSILKDVTFEALPGSTTALVGPTGAGKTTIVNLITRFYDINSGKILIDDTDIRDYKRDSLRKIFGMVLQDTYLFTGTIRDNIKYGSLEATDAEMIEACKIANAHNFIKLLPNGYDTILTESGSNLSQGQRQLLAIARAILAKPSILILDEATSNVDTRTEMQIQQGMLNMMKGRTCFIIAHRLSTIREANTIMVIDDGRIVEKGNHGELMEKQGVYYNMYNNQYKNLEEAM